jgi:hypothetical protein
MLINKFSHNLKLNFHNIQELKRRSFEVKRRRACKPASDTDLGAFSCDVRACLIGCGFKREEKNLLYP